MERTLFVEVLKSKKNELMILLENDIDYLKDNEQYMNVSEIITKINDVIEKNIKN